MRTFQLQNHLEVKEEEKSHEKRKRRRKKKKRKRMQNKERIKKIDTKKDKLELEHILCDGRSCTCGSTGCSLVPLCHFLLL
jgi:hypothetical protein